MSFLLSFLSPADVPEFVEAELLAFANRDLTQVLFPNGPTADDIEYLRERRLEAFKKPGITFLKVTDTKTGELVAGGTWYEKLSEESRKPAPESSGPSDARTELKEEVFGRLRTCREELMSSKPHYREFPRVISCTELRILWSAYIASRSWDLAYASEA